MYSLRLSSQDSSDEVGPSLTVSQLDMVHERIMDKRYRVLCMDYSTQICKLKLVTLSLSNFCKSCRQGAHSEPFICGLTQEASMLDCYYWLLNQFPNTIPSSRDTNSTHITTHWERRSFSTLYLLRPSHLAVRLQTGATYKDPGISHPVPAPFNLIPPSCVGRSLTTVYVREVGNKKTEKIIKSEYRKLWERFASVHEQECM